MELSQEIKNKIDHFSYNNQQMEILSYLEHQLKQGNTSAHAILDYARIMHWDNAPGTPFVISAPIINRLGIAINNLEDNEQQKFVPEFFLLAAERKSSWANRNYAQFLLEGHFPLQISPPEVLNYARAAVGLAQNNPSEQHEHKFILCKALRANQLFREANSTLMDFLNFKLAQIGLEKDQAAKKTLEIDIENSIKLCEVIINEFDSDFVEANKNNLTIEHYQTKLAELEPIVACEVRDVKFLALKQKALFLKGQYCEKLDELQKAWAVYCSITDKTLPLYEKVIKARALLLKKQINTLIQVLEEPISLNLDFLSIKDRIRDDLSTKQANSSILMLPQDIPLPAKFISACWTKEAAWFDAVDKDKCVKRITQIEILIAAKQEEINLLDETLKQKQEQTVTDRLEQKKQALKIELEQLQALKNKLLKYLPETRRIYRRYAAETKFFNPSRSKKIKDIVELTEKIIDHRFRIDKEEPTPINLTDKSTRLLITAERVFQEAVLVLSGANAPQLGIPQARISSWTSGDYNQYSGTTGYGPEERYQVSSTVMKSEHRTSPKRHRLGDSYLPEHGTYSGDIFPFLSKITSNIKEKEQQVAKFLIRYGQKHQPITLAELKAIYTQANEADVDHFNRICFLVLEKEQTQWHSATQEEYQLGMTVAQARCLIMIEAGFLSFTEILIIPNNTPKLFGIDEHQNIPFFGVYSHKNLINNIHEVKKSCDYIDSLYMQYLQTKYAHDYLKFFKENITKKSPPTCLLTREQAHLDLIYVYGGESDTDDEGYDTDIDLSM